MITSKDITTETSLLAYIGGRKFTLALVMSIMNTGLVFFGKIDPGVYSVVSVTIVTAYIAGNVYQRVTTAKVDATTTPTTTP